MKKIVFLFGSFLIFSSVVLAQVPELEINDNVENTAEEIGGAIEQGFGLGGEVTASEGVMANYTASFTVVNTSKENADATFSGAHLGDVLLYELTLTGSSSGVVENIAIDLADMWSDVSIENMLNGTLEGMTIAYTDVNEISNNWNRTHGLYVRVKPGEKTSDSLVARSGGTTLRVPLLDFDTNNTCIDCDLTESGPSNHGLWVTLALVIGFAGIALFQKRKTS